MTFVFFKRKKKDSLRDSSVGDYAGDVAATSTAALCGAAASGTVAEAVGATSLPILTSVGSFFGATLVAATPVGWVIGTGAAAAAIGYGISRAVKRTGKNIGRCEKEADIRDARIIKEQEARQAEKVSNQDEAEIKELLKQLPEDIDPRYPKSILETFLSGKRSKQDTISMISDLAGKPVETRGFVDAVTDEILLRSAILFSKSMVYADGDEDLGEVDVVVQRLSEKFEVPDNYVYRLYGEAPMVDIEQSQVNELQANTSAEFMKYLHAILREVAEADGRVVAAEKKLLRMIAQPS